MSSVKIWFMIGYSLVGDWVKVDSKLNMVCSKLNMVGSKLANG